MLYTLHEQPIHSFKSVFNKYSMFQNSKTSGNVLSYDPALGLTLQISKSYLENINEAQNY